MEQITIEQLKELLQAKVGEDITVVMSGIVSTEIYIEKMVFMITRTKIELGNETRTGIAEIEISRDYMDDIMYNKDRRDVELILQVDEKIILEL